MNDMTQDPMPIEANELPRYETPKITVMSDEEVLKASDEGSKI